MFASAVNAVRTDPQSTAARKADPSRSAPAALRAAPDAANLGNQARLRLQRKLVFGSSNDPVEHDADTIAERILRGAPALELSSLDPGDRLRRTCGACEEEEMRRAALSREQAPVEEAPDIVHRVLAQPGRPLDAAARAFFEPRFGLDLADVRLHDDAQATESAHAVNARAYTVGNDIVLSGTVDTASKGGLRLLAHELAHVTQQSGGTRPQVARQTAPAGSGAASAALASSSIR
jgi:Domain of unknown function (DUF4157)